MVNPKKGTANKKNPGKTGVNTRKLTVTKTYIY